MRVWIALAALLWLLPGSISLYAQEAGVVRHTISFPRRHNQFVHVRSQWPGQAGAVELAMPSWTPGSYLIRDYAAQLEGLSATSESGQPLTVTKLAKNRWRIDAGAEQGFEVEYDIWAGKLGVADNWVESDVAVLNGAGLFLYSDSSRPLEQQLQVSLPADWPHVHTSLKPLPGGQGFVAADYDELVDSPVLAGRTVARDFEVAGQPYALVLSRENRLWDADRSADDIARLVQAQQRFWGHDPFDRKYLFMNVFSSRRSGLEHDHSTLMTGRPWTMRDRGEYIKWLALVSHEFFHSWNIRRMRPAVLDEYEYDHEVYTRELWLAEGLTSYYDNLLLFRSGLIDVADYFDLLAEEFRVYETTPGRQVRSAEDASFDTWIKHYREDDNKVNSTVSYYRKGAVIGFVTDMEIRRATRGRSSLDDVMRTMYSRYGHREAGQGGYPPGAFEVEVGKLAGAGVRTRVENLLRTTGEAGLDEALAWYGLVLNRAGNANGEPLLGVGVSWVNQDGQLVAEQVVQGYSGASAGILPGDELLAVDGLRVTPSDLHGALQRMLPGEEVAFTLARRGRLISLPVVIGEEVPEAYFITPGPRIKRQEKQRMENWLGRELQFNQ